MAVNPQPTASSTPSVPRILPFSVLCSLFSVLCSLPACARPPAEPPEPPPAHLTVSSQHGGRVTSEPGGIWCGTACTAEYTAGTVVTLRVELDPGVEFAGWSGACDGAGWCAVAVEGETRVAARFVLAGTDRPVPDSMNPPADLDHDGVLDDVDACPVEAGAAETQGCPP